uniref:Uncharacterized protein n=1 Tax=Tanacetum cinerariifolium TaxID=118510 RepID=A0A6L2L405_TANCI|nr:hypothetical protein [Tanacetum cinerariifolium]
MAVLVLVLSSLDIITPLRYAVVIPSSGNQGGSFVALTAEASNTQDSWGKGIMVDDAVAPSGGVSRQRPSSKHAPSFRDVFGDAIHADFFLFSAGPCYATYPRNGVAGNCEFNREELDAPDRPSFGVLTKEGYKEKVACLTGLELQVSTLKKQVSRLNDKLATSDASFAKSKAKEKDRKKKIKSLSKSLDNLHSEVARLSTVLNQDTILEAERGELLSLAASAGFERGLSMHQTKDEFAAMLKKMISEYATEPLSVILQLEPEKLVHSANVPIPRDTHVSPHIAKESTVTLVFESLELSANVFPTSSAIALEQNEEQVSVVVDRSDLEMTDGAAHSKSEGVYVHGTSHVLDDVAEVTVVGSKRVSFGHIDVVMGHSAGEKGDGSAPSSTVEERILSYATRPKPNGFSPGTYSMAGQASVGFPAESVGSSKNDILDSPCLLLLTTGTSQSRQHGKSESDSYYLSD